MSGDLKAILKENVIQGRKTKDDMGINGALSGTPDRLEFAQLALENNISPEVITTQGLTSGMQVVGEKFSTKA